MNKRTRTVMTRRWEVRRLHDENHMSVAELASKYHVSEATIYNDLKWTRENEDKKPPQPSIPVPTDANAAGDDDTVSTADIVDTVNNVDDAGTVSTENTANNDNHVGTVDTGHTAGTVRNVHDADNDDHEDTGHTVDSVRIVDNADTADTVDHADTVDSVDIVNDGRGPWYEKSYRAGKYAGDVVHGGTYSRGEWDGLAHDKAYDEYVRHVKRERVRRNVAVGAAVVVFTIALMVL